MGVAASRVVHHYSEFLLEKHRNKRRLSKKQEDKRKKRKVAGAGPGSHTLITNGSEQNGLIMCIDECKEYFLNE